MSTNFLRVWYTTKKTSVFSVNASFPFKTYPDFKVVSCNDLINPKLNAGGILFFLLWREWKKEVTG